MKIDHMNLKLFLLNVEGTRASNSPAGPRTRTLKFGPKVLHVDDCSCGRSHGHQKLISAEPTAILVEDLIKKQEVEAVTAYQQHLSGMGLEFWDYVRPWEHESECIKSVWKMYI